MQRLFPPVRAVASSIPNSCRLVHRLAGPKDKPASHQPRSTVRQRQPRQSQHASTLRPAKDIFNDSAYLQVAAIGAPLCPSTHPREQSGVVFLQSLSRCGIQVSPTGKKMISRILQDVPYDGIDPSWVRRVGAAVCVPRVDATTLAPIPSTYNLLSPSGVYLTVRTTGTTPSLVPNREWVKRHAQLLGEQLLADPRWAGLVEIMLFDDGLGTGVDGAVELRAALEAMLSKGWIVPLRTEGDSLSQALARQGDDGWVEHA